MVKCSGGRAAAWRFMKRRCRNDMHLLGKTLNSAAGLAARVRIRILPCATSRLLYKLLGRVRLGFLVVSPFRIAGAFLHVERSRSSKRVWRSPRIIHFIYGKALLIPWVRMFSTKTAFKNSAWHAFRQLHARAPTGMKT
jgi:hypothetical protein